MPKSPSSPVHIEKLVFGGQGLAYSGSKVYLVWNALPGEDVKIRVLGKSGGYAEAVAEEILRPSPDRIPASEDHFLACSPWQILSWQAENEWKQKTASETLRRIGKVDMDPAPLTALADAQAGYRHKMEYSFASSSGDLRLAFFERGSRVKRPIEPCRLAVPAVNQTALKTLEWLRREKIAERALKSLVVRSDAAGNTLAGLFLNDELRIPSHPVLDETFRGFQIYHSAPKSPSAVPDRLLAAAGEDWLCSALRGIRLRYGLLSFFQINVPLFEKVLEDMARHLDPGRRLVDFYSGVGAIGLALSDRCRSCILVDSHEEAARCAEENVRLNGLQNVRTYRAPAEKMTGFIDAESDLICDPPRAGLHPKVVQRILREKPGRVLYLSCNVSTQARDLQALSAAYEVRDLRLYNLFPRTPHIESLCVLEKKALRKSP